VAYTSTDTGDPQVYVQPFPNATGGKWLVSTSGGSEPRWSADGKEIARKRQRTAGVSCCLFPKVRPLLLQSTSS